MPTYVVRAIIAVLMASAITAMLITAWEQFQYSNGTSGFGAIFPVYLFFGYAYALLPAALIK